jgi:predicted DNA-binding transcriptional regulator AlpA
MHLDPPSPPAKPPINTGAAACKPLSTREKKAFSGGQAYHSPKRAVYRLPLQSRSIPEATAMQSNTPPLPSAPPLAPGDFVDEAEAAAILGVSRKTIANWRWRGEGPRATKIGRRLVRYHRADLAKFAAGDAA